MPDEMKVNQSLISLMKGDIIGLDVEAIVYYARPDLVLGSGFGGAIATKGGPKVQEELKKMAPVKTTEVVVTAGGSLKAKYILHAAGPRFQEENLEDKLRDTVLNVLRKAEENKIQSLAFPALGVGFYGIPLDLCAEVMLSRVKEYLKKETSLKEVIVCLRDSREYGPFQQKMKEIRFPWTFFTEEDAENAEVIKNKNQKQLKKAIDFVVSSSESCSACSVSSAVN